MDVDEIFNIAFSAREQFIEEPEEKVDKSKCKNCGNNLCNDYFSGSVICMSCGFVSETSCINEEPEWNNYTEGVDNSRCTVTSNNGLFTDESNIGTTVNKFTKNTPKYLKYTWTNSRDRSLYKVYTKLDNICLACNIQETILIGCKLIYKYVSTNKLNRGKIREGVIASCLYYSFIYHNVPRTIHEISIIYKIDEKKINKTNKIVSELLWESECYKHIISKTNNIEDFVYRFVSDLNMEGNISRECINYYNKINKNILIGKDMSYITAGIIYIICGDFISKDKICESCDLSTVTLNKMIKILTIS